MNRHDRDTILTLLYYTQSRPQFCRFLFFMFRKLTVDCKKIHSFQWTSNGGIKKKENFIILTKNVFAIAFRDASLLEILRRRKKNLFNRKKNEEKES